MTEIAELADRLFGGIERGDIEAVKACYAPDVVVWHNFDRLEQGRDQNLATLAWCARHIEGMRYTDVHRVVHSDGFVQQHVLRGRTASGADLQVPACIVARVAGGRITRIDEYLDSTQIAPLIASTA